MTPTGLRNMKVRARGYASIEGCVCTKQLTSALNRFSDCQAHLLHSYLDIRRATSSESRVGNS
jgi:hypothetical protein